MTPTILEGDCLDRLDGIDSETVDLVVADPPFNVGVNYGKDRDRRIDYYGFCGQWIEQCFRVLKPTGSIAVMTIGRHLEKLFPIMAYNGDYVNLIMWRNVAAVCSKKMFWPSYQPILIYSKTPDYKFNTYAERRKPEEMLTTGGHKSRWAKDHKVQGRLLDYWKDITNIYAGNNAHPEAILKPGTYEKEHPCQMPEALAGRLIRFLTDPGDVVLDPFAGSGTTLIAATKLGRNSIGIEIDPKHCKMIRRRIEKEADMFGKEGT